MNGFNFVGFDPDDEKYTSKVKAFSEVFENLGLFDLFIYDFSIDVYYLDMLSVINSNGAYFKQLSNLSSYIDFNSLSDSDHALGNQGLVISELATENSGYTFQKFMNSVKRLNRQLDSIDNKNYNRKDYFTIVKYSRV